MEKMATGAVALQFNRTVGEPDRFPQCMRLSNTAFKAFNVRAFESERGMNFTKNIGHLLLAIYLILVGIIALAGVAIPSVVIGILALLAGIFILIGK
jgi:type IV secretory pathway VirB6-like protein